MGLFDKLKANNQPSREQILLVFNDYLVHQKQDFISSKKPTPAQKTVKEIILAEQHRKMAIAFEALEYLGEPQSWSELIFALTILPHAGVGGSTTTIRYANKLFDKDYVDDSSAPTIPPLTRITKRDLLSFRALTAKAYEHEQDFQTAITWYKEAAKLGASHELYADSITRCFIRLGQFDEALTYLDGIKRKPIYTQEHIKNSFGDTSPNYIPKVIDDCVADVQSKKERGYVYKPRKSKSINPLSEKYTYCDQ